MAIKGDQGRSHLAIRMSPGICSRNDVGADVTGGGVTGGGVSPDAVARGMPERRDLDETCGAAAVARGMPERRDLDETCGAAAVVDVSGGAAAEDSAAADGAAGVFSLARRARSMSRGLGLVRMSVSMAGTVNASQKELSTEWCREW